MHKRSFMIIVLVILLGQPIIAGVSMPTALGLNETSMIQAEDYGYRLDPGDLTPHVPIAIDGNGDWVSQGWPGAGTPGDPYVIEGLNITQDIGVYMINIVNSDVSFVIKDCLLQQGDSSTYTVYLENTTNAFLEYNTIRSDGGGVDTWNANYTTFEHNLVICALSAQRYAFRLHYSHTYSFVENEFRSLYRGLYGIYTHDITFTGNLWNSSDNWYATYFDYCNRTSFTDDMIIKGYSLRIRYSYDISIVNLHNNGSGGIQAYYGGNWTIDNCNLDSNDGPCIDIDGTVNVDITNCYMSAPNDYGVSIVLSENVTFHNNELEGIDNYGISVSSTDHLSIIDNSVSDCGNLALNLDSCDFVIIENFTSMNSAATAISVNTCNNGTLTNSIIMESGDSGIFLDTAHNWTITANVIESVDNQGIYVNTGDNHIIDNNTLTDAGYGISAVDSDNGTINDNQISDILNQGITIDNCDRVEVIGNTIDIAEDGILALFGHNQTIKENTLTNIMDTGMSLTNMDDVFIGWNVIDSGPLDGLYGDSLDDCEFYHNTLTDCGFRFEQGVLDEYYHVVINNTVNGLPVYYNPDHSGEDILASDYGQILLVNNTWFDIHDNVYGLVTVPVQTAYCANIDIWELDTSGNLYGMLFYETVNLTITNHTHYGSDISGGIGIINGDSISVLDSVFKYGSLDSSSIDSIYAYNTDNFDIEGCLFDGNEYGVFTQGCENVLISDNQFHNTEKVAISGYYTSSENIQVLNNEILNATHGIIAYDSDNWTIMHNLIMYCSDTGIWVNQEGADDVNITLNVIENNEDGIWISTGDFATIANNTIRWNEYFGVYLTGSSGTQITYNTIALNRLYNGGDQNFRYWDDGVATGNWWDDASPPTAYDIYGGGGSQDRYPMLYAPTSPVISQPQDIYYAEGSEGNEIIWYAYDDALKNWEAEVDGSFWSGDAWNYDNITLDIDGLEYGTHTITLTLWDVDLNNVTDTVQVFVYDGTPPTISNTPNTWVFVGGSGQTLSWKVADLHPENYTVYLDDEVWDSGSWDSGELVVNVDGITEGEHVLRTVIYDIDGNTASDTVLIRSILDDVNPTIDSPDDISYYTGETGHIISWNATDDYPAYFEVRYNGSIQVEGSWGGSRILVNVDGLSVGTHTFELTVYDGTGNNVADSVTVTVLAIEGVEPPPEPIDLTLLLIVAGVAGAAVVIVVVVMFLKKKQAAV